MYAFSTCTHSLLRAFAYLPSHLRAFAVVRILTHPTTFDVIHAHSCRIHSADDDLPDVAAYQSAKREMQRGKNPPIKVYKTKGDLLNFMKDHKLPSSVEEMVDKKLYAVDKMAEIWDAFPNTTALAFTAKISVGWMEQLLALQEETSLAWALHGDGKHKLHHGRWVLMTFGTHSLNWSPDHKSYRHSFRPLIYLFSKQIESIESVKYAMKALQIVSIHFFGKRLQPSVNISDHSDGLREGMQYINIDSEQEEVHIHAFTYLPKHSLRIRAPLMH